MGRAAGTIPNHSSRQLIKEQWQSGKLGGGDGSQPEGGRRMALVLSSEARWCPHDPDLRMPMGCHQENTKDTGDRGGRDQCNSHSQYRLAFGETSFRILEKRIR